MKRRSLLLFTQRTSGLEPEKRTSLIHFTFFIHFQCNILFFHSIPFPFLSFVLSFNLWMETHYVYQKHKLHKEPKEYNIVKYTQKIERIKKRCFRLFSLSIWLGFQVQERKRGRRRVRKRVQAKKERKKQWKEKVSHTTRVISMELIVQALIQQFFSSHLLKGRQSSVEPDLDSFQSHSQLLPLDSN